MATRNLNRARVSVEQLEDRRLLSVTVTPPRINLKSIDHGEGVFTVRISGTDTTTAALLHSPTSLTETVTESSAMATLGKPLRMVTTGNGTLMLKFRRSDLKPLGAGTATLTVSNGSGSGSASESATITIFGSASHGHHGHHGNHGSHHHHHHHHHHHK
jgi:hypothetical protein